MDYFKYFNKDCTANTTTHADGLTSSAEAPKRLKSVMVTIDLQSGDKVQGWLEREKVFELPDYLIETQQEGTDNKHPFSMNKINEIPVGVDMPVGTTFTIALECGGVGANISGAYRYEIIGS